MTDQSDNAKYQHRDQTKSTKMPENDLGTRKTLFVLVIVVGCFAVLWPKVFYPMLVGQTNQRLKPNHLDKGCCDVISDIDVNTIKIMSELCNTIVHHSEEKPLKAQAIIKECRTQIYEKCGIDISLILQEQVRLGRSFKQIVDEVRSFNGSFCLKYQFGISPSRLGIPHRITINLSPTYVKQERPSHLRPEMLHPALRERGSAIVQPYQPPTKPGHPKFVDGRPGPVPGVRPPMGGAGHMVHSPKGSNSMGVIMPIYTIGIVIFFSYTLMKLLFKKKPEGAGAPLYPPVEPSMTFRKEVFEPQKTKPAQGPLIVNAMTALLDEVDQELEARRKARELASQKEDLPNGTGLVNGCAKQPSEPEQPSVKILGMEMTASCEGGKKWERCESPVIPKSQLPPEPATPPQEIFLEGTLPAQSQLLVADSTVEEETNSVSSSTDPPVILASKMTLSVISLDAQDNDGQNQQTHKHDQDTLEDVIDESKYTTASGTTAAECEISDEEASDINDEIENVPDYITNSVNVEEVNAQKQKIEPYTIESKEVNSINDLTTNLTDSINKLLDSDVKDTIPLIEVTMSSNETHDIEEEVDKPTEGDKIIEETNEEKIEESEHVNNTNEEKEEKQDESEEEEEIEEEVEEELESDVEEIENVHDDTDANSLDDEMDVEEIEEIIVFEDEIDINDEYEDDDEGKVHVIISNETVENIGNIIDEIITDGARRLEADIDNNLVIENLEHSTGESAENSNDEEEENENIQDSALNRNSESNRPPSDLDNDNDFEKDICLDEESNVVRNTAELDRTKLDSPIDKTPME